MRGMSGARQTIKTTFALQLAVWKHPLSEITLVYGVPSRSLKARIHHEEITKPPPEYWEKIKRGLSRNQALREIGWTPSMIKKINDILLDAKKCNCSREIWLKQER